jgi:hypothetical protein
MTLAGLPASLPAAGALCSVGLAGAGFGAEVHGASDRIARGSKRTHVPRQRISAGDGRWATGEAQHTQSRPSRTVSMRTRSYDDACYIVRRMLHLYPGV